MVQIFSRIKLYNALAILFIWQGKLGPLKKRIKTIDIQMKLFRITAGSTLFDNRTNLEILEQLKVEPVD
jgi:hypothetical protein